MATKSKRAQQSSKPKSRRQLEEELATMRRWLTMLSREWIGEGAGLMTLVYTNRRQLTESEDTRASVITRAGYELDRVLREVGSGLHGEA
jgi:hypothetical protein